MLESSPPTTQKGEEHTHRGFPSKTTLLMQEWKDKVWTGMRGPDSVWSDQATLQGFHRWTICTPQDVGWRLWWTTALLRLNLHQPTRTEGRQFGWVVGGRDSHGKLFQVSCSLPNKTKLKFDQDFKACWSFCLELKVLNESKYSMSWVRCAFGNIYNIHYPCKRAGSKIHHKNYEDVPCHSLHIASHSRIVQLVLFPVWYMCKIMFTLNSEYIINTKYSQPLIFLAACIHQIKENCYNRRWNLSGIGLFSFDWKFFLLGFDDKLDFILRTPQLKSAIWGKRNFLTHYTFAFFHGRVWILNIVQCFSLI